MIGQLAAIAWNGFREARRNRVTIVVAIFAVVLMLATALITELTVTTFRRVVIDFGLGSMTLLLVVLAVFLSTGQLSKEIDRRTIFLLVTKPIGRGTFVVGRLLGTILTVSVLQAAMGALFFIELGLVGESVGAAQVQAVAMLTFELMILASIGTLMATFAETLTSVMVTGSVFLAGHLSSDLYLMASKAKAPAIKLAGQVAYWLIPNLSRVSFRSQATYDQVSSGETLLSAAGYALVWVAFSTCAAVIVFQRRDFK